MIKYKYIHVIQWNLYILKILNSTNKVFLLKKKKYRRTLRYKQISLIC